MQGSCGPLVTALLSTHQCLALSYVRFCSKSPYWIYTVGSLTVLRPTALCLVPERSWPNILPRRHSQAFPGNTRQHVSTTLGGRFTHWSQQKAQKSEKRGAKLTAKRTTAGWERKQEGRAGPCSLCVRQVHAGRLELVPANDRPRSTARIDGGYKC